MRQIFASLLSDEQSILLSICIVILIQIDGYLIGGSLGWDLSLLSVQFWCKSTPFKLLSILSLLGQALSFLLSELALLYILLDSVQVDSIVLHFRGKCIIFHRHQNVTPRVLTVNQHLLHQILVCLPKVLVCMLARACTL